MAAVTQVRILVTAWTKLFFVTIWPKIQNKTLRRPGIEPGSTAWKAAMLTIIPPTLQVFKLAIDACIMVTFALIYHR